MIVFNEGYLATGPDTDPVRQDLTAEAIRLTRLLRALMPGDGEVAGLFALILLKEARRKRAIAVAELDGPDLALATVDALEEDWPAITPSMRPAPTSCAGWAGVRSRAPRTTERSSWSATPPRPPT